MVYVVRTLCTPSSYFLRWRTAPSARGQVSHAISVRCGDDMDDDGLKTRDRKLALGRAVPSDWTWTERLCQRCRRRRCCPWLSADISTLFSPSLLLFFLRSALVDSAQSAFSL